jgi:hypothetical protein
VFYFPHFLVHCTVMTNLATLRRSVLENEIDEAPVTVVAENRRGKEQDLDILQQQFGGPQQQLGLGGPQQLGLGGPQQLGVGGPQQFGVGTLANSKLNKLSFQVMLCVQQSLT